MTLEERVETLEAQVALLTGEGEYTLGKAGETIDAILDGIETGAIYHGTKEVVVEQDRASATGILISLSETGFTPTANTAVVASLRKQGGPQPWGYVLNLYFVTGATPTLRYSIFWGGNTGAGTPEQDVRAGTYYIDWICIDKGES